KAAVIHEPTIEGRWTATANERAAAANERTGATAANKRTAAHSSGPNHRSGTASEPSAMAHHRPDASSKAAAHSAPASPKAAAAPSPRGGTPPHRRHVHRRVGRTRLAQCRATRLNRLPPPTFLKFSLAFSLLEKWAQVLRQQIGQLTGAFP